MPETGESSSKLEPRLLKPNTRVSSREVTMAWKRAAALLSTATSSGRMMTLPVSCAQKAERPKKTRHSRETTPSQVSTGQSASSPQRASAARVQTAVSALVASRGSNPARESVMNAPSRRMGRAP